MRLQRKTTLGLLAGAACLLSTQAFAAPITSFDFTVGGGFVDGTATCDGGGTCGILYSDIDPLSGNYLNITWGTPFPVPGEDGNTSGLQITHNPEGYGALQVGVGPQRIGAFSHSNFVLLASGGWMNFVNLTGMFNLFAPDSSLIAGISQTNNLAFHETRNDILPCADPSPEGNKSDCDDVFTTEALTGSFDFTIGDYIYTFSFGFERGDGITGLQNTTWDFEDGNGPVDVVRIWTKEDGVSTIYTTATIDVRSVPAPGTLALFGLSLLGLGGYARRKNRV